jgi:hypothetical protein
LELGDQLVDLNYYLAADYADAAEASAEIPAVIEWVNEHYQAFIQQKHQAKSLVRQARSKAYFDLKGALWASRGYTGKITEKAIEAAIELEQSVIDAEDQLAIFNGWVARLFNTMENLRAKLDMIRTSEATRRAMLEEADHRPSEE